MHDKLEPHMQRAGSPTFFAKLLSPLVLKLPEVCTVSIFSHTLAPTLSDSFLLLRSGVCTYSG